MIKIKAIERKAGFGKTSKKLWYPAIHLHSDVQFEEFIELVSDETTVSSADVKAVFDRAAKVLIRLLQDGIRRRQGREGRRRTRRQSQGHLHAPSEGQDCTEGRSPGACRACARRPLQVRRQEEKERSQGRRRLYSSRQRRARRRLALPRRTERPEPPSTMCIVSYWGALLLWGGLLFRALCASFFVSSSL